MRIKLIATATFGLEAVVRREIQALGYQVIATEDGHVEFFGDERAIARCNIWLRCADRLLLKMVEFTAVTFEELYQQVKGIEWEELIPPEGDIIVTGSSVKSELHSVPACQSITEKAIVDRLMEAYGVSELPETGATYKVKVAMRKDKALITVDTSGQALHKRGYRRNDVAAPIKETLAAALVQLSFWKEGRILVDPCCGSGTIPIEAAMMGRNRAPGLDRSFVSQGWSFVPYKVWEEEFSRAKEEETGTKLDIRAMDADPGVLEAARENAALAKVEDTIRFSCKDAEEFYANGENGIIITNPPYGQRVGDEKAMEKIYRGLRTFLLAHPDWSLFLITSDKAVEKKIYGRPADRRRKLFNGNIEACYYQFHGDKPKR